MPTMKFDLSLEEAMLLILENECYNPDEDYNEIDINKPETWARRKYYIEGHCVGYTIVTDNVDGKKKIISIELETI